MAILVRNLLIFFLIAFCLFLVGLFYSLENRLVVYDYSAFIEDLQQQKVAALSITGSRVEVTDITGFQYVTRVPEPHLLLEVLGQKPVRVAFHDDYTLYYFQGGIFVFAIMLALVVWLSFPRQKNVEEDQKFARDKLIALDPGAHQVRFKDVAGLPEAQEELEEVVSFLKNPEQFSVVGASIPKGLLLQGPPGTGKTLLARAIAGEAGVPFFSFSGSDFVEMFVGVGASRVRDLFTEAKKNAPCIVFIDEIDAVGSRRTGGTADGHDERGQTLNALLVEMDGFRSTDNIIVLAATNRPDVLDPALRRPGRFDRQITTLPPDIKGRIAILQVHCAKVQLSPEVDLEEIAQFTSGFTGAELANLVNEAALLAARKGMGFIDKAHFDLARDRILLGVERKGMVITGKDKQILACHEAGHAIVAKILPESDPVHKITIIPRGRALGQTQQLPLGDRHAYSMEYLRNRITMLLGGRAAEQLVFNERTTRAENDLELATDIATNMICKWGMSETLGPQAYVIDSGDFLDGGSRRRTMGNTTSYRIDEEIKGLLNDCYNQALELLSQERIFLKVLSEILLQVETLDSEEFEIIYQCSLTQKAKKKKDTEESECAVCPAKGQCLHY